MIFVTNSTSDIFRNCYVISRAVRRVKLRQFWNLTSGIYAKYHTMLLNLQKVCYFHCRYFKLSWNTTAPSQSNCRNFSCSGITGKPLTYAFGRTSTEISTKNKWKAQNAIWSSAFFDVNILGRSYQKPKKLTGSSISYAHKKFSIKNSQYIHHNWTRNHHKVKLVLTSKGTKRMLLFLFFIVSAQLKSLLSLLLCCYSSFVLV